MNGGWPKAPTLGEVIRRQRELARLPMRQLAAMAGISNPYLSQIERGLRDPSDQVLTAIADSTVDALQKVGATVVHRTHEVDRGLGTVNPEGIFGIAEKYTLAAFCRLERDE